MAFNFAETFLRESGAAQDRAQSMAEMQLRAKQFADEMILRETDLAIRKEAHEFNKADQLFRQATEAEKLEIERDVAEKANELREIQMEISRLELADLKKGDEFVTDEEAERYNVPKGTKRKDIASSLELRGIALQNELYESEVQNKLKEKVALQDFYNAKQALLEKPIEEQEAFDFSKEDEQIGFFGKIGRGIGSGFLDFITGTPGLEGYSQAEIELMGGFGVVDTGVGPLVRDEEARQRLINLSNKLARERELGLTTKGQERIIGKSRSDLLNPLYKDLYNAAVTSGYFNISADALNTQATFDLLPQGVSFPSADINSYLQSLRPAGPTEEE
jgi:hypothetical protein